MNFRLKWRSGVKPLAWVSLALLGTCVVVSALIRPGGHLLSNWGGEDLSTVLPAKIKPSSTFTVSARLNGTISSLLVSAGARIKPGDLLAKIDSEELNDGIERAQRRLRFAKSRLAALRPHRDKSVKRLQNERYISAQRSKRSALERLSAYSYTDLEKSWNDAKLRTVQIRSLLDQQLATSAELDDALARERQALNELKAAREHKSRLKQEADQADTQLKMTSVAEPRENNSDALLAVQLELEDAQEALRQINDKKQDREVRASRAGTIVQVQVHAGDRVLAGQALFQVADISELSFEVPVSAAIAEMVHPGRAVFVRIPTDPPRRQAATVSSVLLSTDQDRPSYIVRITIPNPNPEAILAGLDGAVEFPHLDSQWKRHPSF